MRENTLQYEDDDFTDEESQENSYSSSAEIEDIPRSNSSQPITKSRPANQSEKPRRLRVRPMNQSMMEKHPNVVSIMLTKNNGQQLIFVRK